VAADYGFRAVFELTALREEVFDAALAPERWLADLHHVRRIERLTPGAADGRGARYRTTVAAASPYRLRWEMTAERVVAPELIAWRAEGDLAGSGVWELEATGAGTRVVSTAHLATTRWWMNLLEPVARPLFVRNHDVVMRAGVETLAGHLDAEVRCFERGDLVTADR
jgi:hypothetical protein